MSFICNDIAACPLHVIASEFYLSCSFQKTKIDHRGTRGVKLSSGPLRPCVESCWQTGAGFVTGVSESGWKHKHPGVRSMPGQRCNRWLGIEPTPGPPDGSGWIRVGRTYTVAREKPMREMGSFVFLTSKYGLKAPAVGTGVGLRRGACGGARESLRASSRACTAMNICEGIMRGNVTSKMHRPFTFQGSMVVMAVQDLQGSSLDSFFWVSLSQIPDLSQFTFVIAIRTLLAIILDY